MTRNLQRPPTAVLLGVALAAVLMVMLAAPVLARGWTRPQRVTSQSDSSLSSLHEVASDGGILHLVHARMGPGKTDDRVIYQRSGNGGSSWTRGSALWVSRSRRDAVIPNLAIAARSNLVVAVFRVRGRHGAVLLARASRNGGRSFGPRVAVATAPSSRGLGVPAVAIGAGGAVVVAWTDRHDHQVRVRRSSDGGRRFGPPTKVASTGLSIDCAGPRVIDGLVDLTATGSTIYVAWSDAPKGACISDRIRIRTSRDDGRSWSQPRLVTAAATFGWPEMSARSGKLLVSLQRPDGSILLARSTDHGRSFQQLTFQADGTRELGAADVMLAEGGRAWLVVPDVAYRGVKVASSRLRFRVSTDSGRTWQPGTTIVADAARLRQAPNLGVWHGKPVVLYQSGPVHGTHSDIWAMRAR